jgi:hypothetical protein
MSANCGRFPRFSGYFVQEGCWVPYLTDLFLHPALAAVSELSDSSNNLASLYCLFLLICANFLITNTISLLSSLRTQEDGC